MQTLYNYGIIRPLLEGVFSIMPKIIPIKDLKNTAEISELCHSTNEPVYITKNGYGDMVIMSMEAYEQAFNLEKMYADLEISEYQIKVGETEDAFSALQDIREKYDL